MRNFFLLACLLFLPFLIFSQEAVKKANSASAGGLYLDASGGLSIPLGSYASGDVNSSNSGFATTGFMAQVNLDWIGKDNYGLGLQYTFQHNALKSSVKNETLPKMNDPLGTGSWSNHYIMAGLVVLKFFHKVYFEGKILAGVIFSSSPIFKTVDPETHNPSNNTGTGFAWGIQVGAGYAVSPRVTVKASLEYLIGNPKIHHQYGAQQTLDTVTGTLIYSAPVTMETKRTVSALLVKAGIVVKLSK
jgi:opacity protein-like surface antigen